MSKYAHPVEIAHRAIHQPGAQVNQVLASLLVPPLHTIPSVSDATSESGQWVRYTAMVQDIWDTEMFVASSPDHKSGLLVENAAASDSPEAKMAERLPVYLVSLPGETAWMRSQKLSNSTSAPFHSSELVYTCPTPVRLKRARETDTEMSDTPVEIASAVETRNDVVPSCDKRSRPEASTHTPNTVGIGLNLPVHDQPGASAVVAKLYDTDKARQLKINTLVDVVGILQDGLDLSSRADETDDFAAEFAARNPTNVKRLHVVSWRELEAWSMHPLTSQLGKAGVEAARSELFGVVGGMRQMLLRYFASALYGDLLAAEYLLMCLLSRPSRTENGTVLGKLSVNIVLPNAKGSEAANSVLGALRNLCASVVEIPVNIAGLNSVDLFPKKDYTLNRLKAGALQVASGTCLFGNECALSDGRLAERGVKNVRALTAVSQRCMLPVDLEYYEAEIAVDCCMVLVSNSGKSIIPTDVVVRVKEDRGRMKSQTWETYDTDLLRKMRLALLLLREDGKFNICDEVATEVENVYVDARKCGQAKDGQETLQKWLSVARCCSRSFGESSLTTERWLYAVNLERTRLEQEKK